MPDLGTRSAQARAPMPTETVRPTPPEEALPPDFSGNVLPPAEPFHPESKCILDYPTPYVSAAGPLTREEEDMSAGAGGSGNESLDGSTYFPVGASAYTHPRVDGTFIGLPLGPFRFPPTRLPLSPPPNYSDISAASSPAPSPMDTLPPVETLPSSPPPAPTIETRSVGTDSDLEILCASDIH